MPAPVVAIIGRPNVGKSTFFNRVLGERRAVVHDRPGITRDRNAVRAEWSGRSFLLVDTGGFLPTASEGRDAEVRKQAEIAVRLASVVLFMVDAKTGVTDLDRAIGLSLRKSGCTSLLIVNKVDKPGDPIVHDFHRLGLGEPIPIAAEGGYGIGDLLDAVVEHLPPEPAPELPDTRVAIVGRPNVGKSSIVNALLGEGRMVVDAVAGTTVDAIDSVWHTAEGDFTLVDTAGIRRQSHFGDESEFYASLRALNALERSDIACLVVDASEGFHRQEARLAHDAYEAGCSLLLVYNKWDLLTDREMAWKRLMTERADRYPSLADVPAIPLSATVRTHLHRLPGAILQRVKQHRRRIATSELNDWLIDVRRKRAVPSTRLGHTPKIYYMTQTGQGPPEFTLFVNHPSRLSDNYRRFLWQQLVEHFDFRGTPTRLRVRKSE